MENEEKSSVWLVSLEGQGLEKREGKYSKQKLFDYPSQPVSILFPVGYVIKHPTSWGGVHEDFGGFSTVSRLVSRPIYDNATVSHLEGELLTVIDAAFTDQKQREAIKSLVRNTIWSFNARQERKVKEIFKSA